jgi:hypothetical protein
MPIQSRLIFLPFELRAIIHHHVFPNVNIDRKSSSTGTDTVATIPCCSSLLPSTTTNLPTQLPTQCLLPFHLTTLPIDPLSIALSSPHLAPPATFEFCSIRCLRRAMRLGTEAQRKVVLREGCNVRVPMGGEAVRWVVTGDRERGKEEDKEVPFGMVEERPIGGRAWGEIQVVDGEVGEMDGEDRLCVVREEMFRRLSKLVRYTKGAGTMHFWWSGKERGMGGVELRL